MKCTQCNSEIEAGDTMIPVDGGGFLCGMICNSQYNKISDMEFLLSFTPFAIDEGLPKGLSPEFYHSLSYEGDVKIAKRIKDIREKYGIPIRGHRGEDNKQG